MTCAGSLAVEFLVANEEARVRLSARALNRTRLKTGNFCPNISTLFQHWGPIPTPRIFANAGN